MAMKQLHAYYLFGKSPIPKQVGKEISDEIKHLSQNSSKESFLKGAYDFVTTHHESGRINTILRLFELFATDVQTLWSRKGFMHCTNQNYLLAVLLVSSKVFTESDIKRKWTLIGFISPHQYLKIRIDTDRWIEVDCWARSYDVGFGHHAYGFNTTIRKSFID